jgi:hypothetical protein
MSRKISVIQDQILASIKADPVLSTHLTSPSKVAFYRLITFVVSVSISLMEQVLDIYKGEIQRKVDSAPPLSCAYLQDKIMKFQYLEDSVDPLIHDAFMKSGRVCIDQEKFEIGYQVINPDLRIITRCAVITTGNKTVAIKVAKSEPPTQLTTSEINSLKAYIGAYGAAGIIYEVVNKISDKIGITGEVYYQGQYSAVIGNAVKTAINGYLANIPFNGLIRVSAIEDAIQAVPGVVDVIITEVTGRPDDVAYPGVTFTSGQFYYQPMSGYAVEETTSGHEFLNSIIFIPA